MVSKSVLVCPCCGLPFQAWYQSNVAQVMCPRCGAQVDTEGMAYRAPEPGRRAGGGLVTLVGLAGLWLVHGLTGWWHAAQVR